MTEWNMTASQKKIKFFEDSHDELYERIELIEEKHLFESTTYCCFDMDDTFIYYFSVYILLVS